MAGEAILAAEMSRRLALPLLVLAVASFSHLGCENRKPPLPSPIGAAKVPGTCPLKAPADFRPIDARWGWSEPEAAYLNDVLYLLTRAEQTAATPNARLIELARTTLIASETMYPLDTRKSGAEWDPVSKRMGLRSAFLYDLPPLRLAARLAHEFNHAEFDSVPVSHLDRKEQAGVEVRAFAAQKRHVENLLGFVSGLQIEKGALESLQLQAKQERALVDLQSLRYQLKRDIFLKFEEEVIPELERLNGQAFPAGSHRLLWNLHSRYTQAVTQIDDGGMSVSTVEDFLFALQACLGDERAASALEKVIGLLPSWTATVDDFRRAYQAVRSLDAFDR